jgi:hypothetical protein
MTTQQGPVRCARRVRTVAVAGLCLFVPAGLVCQDVQPRVYTPAPVGVNLITLGYGYSAGAVLFDKTIPIEDAEADIHSLNLAYSRSIGLLGMAGRVDVAVPFVIGDWEGAVTQTFQTASRNGFADPVLRFAVFFVGAPALKREEFAVFRPKTIVGATLRAGVPLGQYDPTRLVNLSSHRWTLSPQLGVSHLAGRFILEASAGVWLFTDNGEFLGTSTQAQDPLYTFQAHVGYRFPRGLWIAASSRQSLGGAIRIDGGDKLAIEANNRVGLTLGVPIGRRYAIRLAATTGVTATVGNDYRTVAAAWQMVF